MTAKRIINLYLFLRRSEEMKLPFTIPRLAALAACSLEPQNSGSLKREFGASQAFWSLTLSTLRDSGLLRTTTPHEGSWHYYETTKTGRGVLEVLEETMNLKTLHDSARAKQKLRHFKDRRTRIGKMQSLQATGLEESNGPSPH